MKIAMIGHKDFPSRIGGVEVVVTELAPRLAAMGHSVTLYNRCGRKGSFCVNGVAVRRVPALDKAALNALTGSITASLAVIRQDYDVIHYHALGPSVMIFLAKLFGKTTVATVHGLDWQRAKWNRFATAYLKLGERVIARYADEVIVLSENVQSYFMEKYGRETIFVENGITPIKICEPNIIREKFGLEKDGYILYLARIVPEKGLHYLIEAHAHIDTDMPLVIAGEVPEGEYGERIKKLAEGKNIIFTGFVQGELMAELYSNCAVYVLPSEIEGLALTLLEAMSAGVRCLTSDIPENTAVTGEFGFSFKSGDAGALAEKLSGLLKSASQRNEAQIAYIEENYSCDAVAAKTEAVYLKAIGRAKGKAGSEAQIERKSEAGSEVKAEIEGRAGKEAQADSRMKERDLR